MFTYKPDGAKVHVKLWAEEDLYREDEKLIEQVEDASKFEFAYHHLAIMPDCHVGYALPIGGVLATEDVVLPYCVGVDIGCGMGAIKTSIDVDNKNLKDKSYLRTILQNIKKEIPMGMGKCHEKERSWSEYDSFYEIVAPTIGHRNIPEWIEDKKARSLDKKNLGTLGSGNHFAEWKRGNDGKVWIMIHSGSRNLGHRICTYYHKVALDLNKTWGAKTPHKDLAFLPIKTKEGQHYLRDMLFALDYAYENRRRIMERMKKIILTFFPETTFYDEINIHHNYASLENHFGKNVWVHRKGATSAKKDQFGIIPGSMGTSSYIVRGLGNPESFMSCSHGAGRVLGRMQASRTLNKEDVENSMGDVVYDRFSKINRGKMKGKLDLGEAPQAYKDIDRVLEQQKDLVEIVVKLEPILVAKG